MNAIFALTVGEQLSAISGPNIRRTQIEQCASVELTGAPETGLFGLAGWRTIQGRACRAVSHPLDMPPFDGTPHLTADHAILIGHNYGGNSIAWLLTGGSVDVATGHPDIHVRAHTVFGGGIIDSMILIVGNP